MNCAAFTAICVGCRELDEPLSRPCRWGQTSGKELQYVLQDMSNIVRAAPT